MTPGDDSENNYKHSVADGIAAVKVIRERAADYGVRPDKIVMLGFSAGAIVTVLATVQGDLSARPNYAAPIYGAPLGGVPEPTAFVPTRSKRAG